MSFGRFRVGLAVAVLFVGFDRSYCAVFDKAKDEVVGGSGKIDIVNTVAEENSTNENYSESKVQQSGADGEIGKEIGLVEESRKKKQDQNQKGFMERLLPMMIIPFMVSTSMIPLMLVSLKLMILKSAFIGKIAILLMLFNMFRRRMNGGGGVFNNDVNTNTNDVTMEHYGYHGDEEYGAYVNHRRRRRRRRRRRSSSIS